MSWSYAKQRQRRRLTRVFLRAQGHICAICGLKITSKRRDQTQRPTIDHVIPKAGGGPDQPGNFVATHFACNQRKGVDPPTGCQVIWLLAVNIRLGHKPDRLGPLLSA